MQAPGSASEASAQQRRGSKPLVEFRHLTALVLGDTTGVDDEVMCIAMSVGVAVVGTRLGSIFALDHVSTKVRKVATNNACIRSLSLDAEGRYCASGTADGRVTVWSLGPGAEPWVSEHSVRPVLSVALCPDYSSGTSEQLAVCASGEDGRLVLHRRSLFSGQTVIHEGEGFVTRILWRTSLIAWANDKGVKVYNMSTGQKVTFIPRPPPEQSTGHCSLAWMADDQLLMGWGNVVKVASIMRLVGGGLYGEVRRQFSIAETICGFASVGPDQFGVLETDRTSTKVVLSLRSSTGEVFHASEVPIGRGAFPSHLHLSFVAPHLPMYLAGPRDILVCQMRDLLEYAVQLLEEGAFDEVIRLANGAGEGIQGLRHIVCLKCLTPDVKEGRFERACKTLERFQSLEAPTWQECIVLFDRHGGLPYVALNLPVPPREQLPQEVYDQALSRMVHCPSALVAVLSWWSQEIFSVESLQVQLRDSLPELASLRVTSLSQDDCCRAEALALLSEGDDPELSARLLLDLGRSEVFRLLRRSLCSPSDTLGAVARLVEANLQRLFEIDDKQACEVLVDCRAVIAVDAVVMALKGHDNRWRHEYLKQLFARDELAGQGYHMQMVRLFAEFEPEGLLPFLRASERYPLEDALGVCQQRGLREEQAYLLGRAGRVKEALDILLEKEEVGDVSRAVDFVSETQDPQLWETLVSFVLERPKLLVPLLDRLDALEGHCSQVGMDSGRPQPPPIATPAHVVRRLPPGTPVRRIATSLQRVLDSLRLSANLHSSCSSISAHEMTARKKVSMETHQRGARISPEGWQCCVCGLPLSQPPSSLALQEPGHERPGRGRLAAKAGIVLLGRKAVHEQCYMKVPTTAT
eukprot:TRINITY_DN32784_c0_g1_i1.p1 TRINITY_DN32784_c0_g1~~TRINITY_DN32784_c0_g1_i1.p1  ORF type:complete len:864 (+),score=160.16 TRINITY_DN32784_c0_g1_i1:52-2643(+)